MHDITMFCLIPVYAGLISLEAVIDYCCCNRSSCLLAGHRFNSTGRHLNNSLTEMSKVFVVEKPYIYENE